MLLPPAVVADRLSLAHWPPGHQIVVCGLSGGVGRTTVAGLLTSILAELPFAHIWKPIAGVELAPHTLGRTAARWGATESDPEADELADVDLPAGKRVPGEETARATSSGAWTFTGGVGVNDRREFSAIVLDAPAGLPSDLPWLASDPTASVLLLVRPDRASLAEAAAALVWMHEQADLPRSRVVVVVNNGVGRVDAGSRAAATALRVRCSGLHRIPFHLALGPGRVLPAGAAMPREVRQPLAHAALDLAAVAARLRSHHRTSTTARPLTPQELSCSSAT